MQNRLQTSIRLDGETRQLLDELARDLEGNRSMTLRRMVRTEADRRGIRADAPPTAAAQVSEVQHGAA